jgi:hypothetical protein
VVPRDPLSLSSLLAWLDRGVDPTGSDGEAPVVLVDLDGADDADVAAAQLHAGVRSIIVGLAADPGADPAAHPAAPACDVILAPHDPTIDSLLETAERHPLASVALAGLLRGAEARSTDDGLLAESAVYSSLQAGPEFVAWRASRPRKPLRDDGDAVELTRDGGRLDITLVRPTVRNALNTTMRDQLVDAFRLVAADPSITEVHLRGAGPAFCAGGDLDEFGSFPDVVTAHLVRLQQSVGRAIDAVRGRVTAHLHGACIGSGIELPAFAGRVLAHADTVIGLPEVTLGLVPGAGGTVSLPRRIGRHRTALLALGGLQLDAPTALAWGLVDELED